MLVAASKSSSLEAVRTSETSVDNYFTRQYIPEDNSVNQNIFSFSVRVDNFMLVAASKSSSQLFLCPPLTLVL
jgi:hypothetical protein